MVLLALSILAFDGAPRQEDVAAFAGRYETKLADGAHCEVDVYATGAFAARCKPGRALHGRVTRYKNSIRLEPEADAYWRDYSIAFGMYMRQTHEQHGFYPSVTSPKPEVPPVGVGFGSFLVPVRWREQQYLVSVDARSDFCKAVQVGRQPDSGSDGSPIYLKVGTAPEAAPGWVEFCSPEWRLVVAK